jgi:hypothetical protein
MLHWLPFNKGKKNRPTTGKNHNRRMEIWNKSKPYRHKAQKYTRGKRERRKKEHHHPFGEKKERNTVAP